MAEFSADARFEPGAVQHGNFINYYDFNPPSNRTELLKDPIHRFISERLGKDKIVCLDIGCNTGELSRAVCNMITTAGCKNVHMLAVDLDPVLIERANEVQLPDSLIKFETCDVTDTTNRDVQWRSYLDSVSSGRRFDLITCFSTTMWIHLNHGDDGLQDLLQSMCRWADNVIVEPQPWKCYRSAARRLKRANAPPFPFYNAIQLRANVVEDIKKMLDDQKDMALYAHLGYSQWNRPVFWYRRLEMD